MKSQKEMGHFIDWQFGVPVKIYHHNVIYSSDYLLVRETGHNFTVMSKIMNMGGQIVFKKADGCRYELIPYKYNMHSPRYPVCQTLEYTAFCNSHGFMDYVGVNESDKLWPYSTATLIIDGKTIELSNETVTNLKKELGI